MLSVLCALGSSLLYALASVFQHRGATGQPDEHSLKVGLLVRLARDPAWLVGLACDAGAYVLQFVALGHGPIVLVQPLLVCGLLFALPIGAALAGRRLSISDWVAAVLVCAGLGVFLSVAHPAQGRDNTATLAWAVLLLAVAVTAGGLVRGARNAPGRTRAVLLAGATGLMYGAAAALTKTASHQLGRGIVPLVTHWQLYLLVAFGAVGMLVGQSAFQAEALDVSLPTMTVSDPLVSIAIGAWMFHEAVAASPAAVSIEILSLLSMTAGIYLLARSEAKAVGARR